MNFKASPGTYHCKVGNFFLPFKRDNEINAPFIMFKILISVNASFGIAFDFNRKLQL
jgi:hypothetical protein